MPVEIPEERTVEVLGLPAAVDEELLFLYFENKRRSGGGPLVSVEKKGDRAILVFEDAKAAAEVLGKGHHVLHNVELSVRRPASKHPHILLLRGINPNTNTEMIELYVENMMELNVSDYTLHRSPGRDLILVHLKQPFKDLEELRVKISKRKLCDAKVSLEQMEQTDSILVENLHPGNTPDLITLHFESKRGGNQQVKEVTMLSEGTAKVSFVNYESVDAVLALLHKLGNADLVVMPYFDFLRPTERLSQESKTGNQDITEKDSVDVPMQTSPPLAVHANSQFSPPMASMPLATHEAAEEEIMEDQTESEDTLSIQVGVADPVKLALFQCSAIRHDIEKAHPNFTIQVKGNGVQIAGSDRKKVEHIERAILDCFGQMSESSFTLEPEKAELLSRKDVKERLLQTLNQTGLPVVYSVSDCNVAVTSLSQESAQQACSFLKSQLCHFSIPVDSEYESMLYCREWSEFLQSLGFSAVKVSEQGGNIDVVTLKDMEAEKQSAIMMFLTTPIEREMVIPMEPGVLKFMQIHFHQLMADMDQVSIFPLEAEDVCGLKIQGHATACQMAEEVLQGVVTSICTRTIVVDAPGITRFLEDEECKTIMKDMQKKFSVYISIKHVPWELLPHQDIFQTAWDLMSKKNFPRATPAGSPQELRCDPMQTDHNGAADNGLLEEARRIVSSVDEGIKEVVSSPQPDDATEVDLYTTEGPASLTDQDPSVMAVDTSQPSADENTTSGNDGALGFSSNLEEEAQLSLAIQYSMESSQWSQEDEEEQLQKALELSKKMIQHETSSSRTNQSPQAKKGVLISLEDAIKSANTLTLFVFASYSCDLIRVDIAFRKKVTQRQVEEKLEHRSVNNMSDYHRKCLEVVKRKHAVDIIIQGTIITVSGFKNFVTAALLDVKMLLERIANSVPDKEILKTVQWAYHDSTEPTPYCPDATVFLENALRMRVKRVDLLLNNEPYTIDFEKMEEQNVASGRTVKISRKMLGAGDLDEDVPEEEYSLLSNMPEATKLNEDSDEFQHVVRSFYETIREYHSKVRIIQVEKLMNRLLYNQYKLKKASVLQRAAYPEVERTLYHGTSESSVKEICIHGFNRSFCGKNATVYGQGVYFAVNSGLSVQDQYSPPNAKGHKFIFVSKVLTGDYTKGCHSMKTAPLRETGDIPLRYDSVTDDITKPAMFVIFNDTQAYPEYLITCERITRGAK